jgi:hypothetical protein
MQKPMLTRGVVLIAVLGFSLLTWGTWGEAHQSGCHRWHSCPSDTGSYVCGDLGYCSQCPDNQYCQGGQPRRVSPSPAPSPPPPPAPPPAPPPPAPPPAPQPPASATLNLRLNQAAFTAGEMLSLTASAAPQGAFVDVYVGLLLPSGELFFLAPTGALTETPQPLTPLGLTQAASAEIFRYTLTGTEPPGQYVWVGVLMARGTTTWVSAVAEAPFTVVDSR